MSCVWDHGILSTTDSKANKTEMMTAAKRNNKKQNGLKCMEVFVIELKSLMLFFDNNFAVFFIFLLEGIQTKG